MGSPLIEETVTGKILVTFATKYSATGEIAEKIAKLLDGGGLQVVLLPLKKVKQTDGYCAVGLGSAVYIGKVFTGPAGVFIRHPC